MPHEGRITDKVIFLLYSSNTGDPGSDRLLKNVRYVKLKLTAYR